MLALNEGEERVGKGQLRHKTLSAYYTHLYTLHDYLLTAPRSSTSPIILETDSAEYKRLIRKTICATRTSPEHLPPKGELWGTQQELVDRVLGEVAKRCAREGIKDVLISSDKVSCFILSASGRLRSSTLQKTYRSMWRLRG